MKRWVLPFLLGLGVFVLLGLPLRVELDSPRLGTPAVLAPGDTLEIRLATSLPFLAPKLQARLEGPEGTANLALEPGWDGLQRVLRSKLPPLADGGYALRLRGGHQDLHFPQAVFIRAAWPRRFLVVQAADLIPPGNEALLDQFVSEMNLIRPAAVLLTGDLAYTGTEGIYRYVEQALTRIQAPVILIAGNHEREHWHRYLDLFRSTRSTVDLGPLKVLSLDSGHGRDRFTPSQMTWLRGELDHPDGRTPILQTHHPVFPSGKTVRGEAGGSGGILRGYARALVELCAEKRVAMVLGGHWHSDAVFDATGRLRQDTSDFPGTKFVVTTCLGTQLRQVTDWPESYYGYRILDIQDGRIARYTYDLAGTGHPGPIASTPLGKLEVQPGNGTATVVNGLNEAFRGAMVTVEGPAENLRPSAGRLVSSLPSGPGLRRSTVEVDLPPNATVTLRMERP